MNIYTTEEIAEIMKVSEDTVRRWLRKGKLQGFKTDRVWRVSEKQLNEMIEGKTSDTGQD